MTAPVMLSTLINRLKDGRVLCVGDVMLDRFTYGEVTRISAEAPIPVCRVVNETVMLGGAGNVARNLDALGAATDFVTVIGADDAGGHVSNFVRTLPGVTASLLVDASRQTTIKDRFIAGVQQLLRVDRESVDPVDSDIAAQVSARAGAALDGIGAVVVSDYGKGVLVGDAIGHLTIKARQADVPLIVDPKGNDYSRYAGAFLITPNRNELADATRMPTGTEEEIIAAARHIAAQHEITNVLVTRSSEGMTLVTPDQIHHLPPEAREVFDVSGAGDTVVATLAAALAVDAKLLDAARLANAAAGIVVGKIGTAVAYPDEIAQAVHRQAQKTPGEAKIQPLAPALDRIAAWRQRGDRIGFTNGCFDLIHPGHVALLAKSRAACDRLIVGLNDDGSVRRLKGDSRPIQNEASRAAVLASLESVDLVVLFKDDTPVKLIEAIKPDILAKGADYTIDQVVGADIVQTHGGEVLLIDLEAGHSTTATIARVGK